MVVLFIFQIVIFKLYAVGAFKLKFIEPLKHMAYYTILLLYIPSLAKPLGKDMFIFK